MKIYELIKYKDLTAALYMIPETCHWEWRCEETGNRFKLPATYSYEELLERGNTWLVAIYNFKDK